MSSQKGFTLVEGLLIVIVLSVIGFSGYYVWNQQQDTTQTVQQTEQKVTSQETGISKGTIETNIPGTVWEKSSEEPLDNEATSYKEIDGSAVLLVYKNNPRIYYSSNAPVYCQLDNDIWVNYSDFDGTGYKLDNTSSPNPCDLKKVSIAGIEGYERYGGALGQTIYAVALNTGAEWLVFTDYKSWNNENPSEQELNEINSQLKNRVSEFISKTVNINEN